MIQKMIGLKIEGISEICIGEYAVAFYHGNGKFTLFTHFQDCCEDVTLEDYEGDIEDLVGSVILNAEEVSNTNDNNSGVEQWTFYKIETNKGGLWMRWVGYSNGFYSTDVNVLHLDYSDKNVENIHPLDNSTLRALHECCIDKDITLKIEEMMRW